MFLVNHCSLTILSQVCFEEDNSSTLSTKNKTVKKVSLTNNVIPMTTIRQNNSTPSHHVVPRPTAGFKVQNAWGESHSVDLMCS